MDFQGLLDNIKEKASSIFEKIREFYEENKMLSYIIAGLTALLLICIILIIVLAGKKKEPEVVPGSVLELTEPLAIPDDRSFQKIILLPEQQKINGQRKKLNNGLLFRHKKKLIRFQKLMII